MDQLVIARDDFQTLLEALLASGYRVLGPTVREDAVAYREVRSVDDLPAGWTDQQGPGTYRLVRNGRPTLFDYVVGPDSWKRTLHPPDRTLWRARRGEEGFSILDEDEEPARLAFLGVRPCEIQALAVHDRVFMTPPFVDPGYARLRKELFVVAVNCGRPGGSCFCASMGTGPRARQGFDIALTEVQSDGRHHFIAEVGSPAGAEVMRAVTHRVAAPAEIEEAGRLLEAAAGRMGRSLDVEGVKELLESRQESGRWEEVAQRCLTCANCTMVCPTCFCTTIEDVTDLAGAGAERRRRWDSCFTMEFSYIHGGSVRRTAAARYRQWLTHKLAAWHDQYGLSGCVGCGRCITWCPVGIDLTEEVRALRAGELAETGV